MPQDVEVAVTDYNCSESMQHQALSHFGLQASESLIQTQPTTYGGLDMHPWNPYVASALNYAVAPGSLNLSGIPLVHTPSQYGWQSGSDGAGKPMEGVQVNGTGCEASVMVAPAGDNYQLCGHYPEHRYYPFQALGTAPVFPASTWFHHSDQNPGIDAQQPWDPTVKAESYQQPPAGIQETVQASSEPKPGGKRDREKANDDDSAEPQQPAPKKRGRPRKIKNADLPPVVTTPTMAGAQELQHSQPSSTMGSWTSQSSPTSYQLSSANGIALRCELIYVSS